MNLSAKQILARFSGLLGSTASILGVTACDPVSPPAMEYGCPYATYRLRGAIRSAQTGKPLEGIQVVMRSADDTSSLSRKAIDTTDVDGNYDLSMGHFPEPDMAMRLMARPVDSALAAANTIDTVVHFANSELTGGDGHWNEGSALKTIDLLLDRPVGK